MNEPKPTPRVGIVIPSHDHVHANFAMAFAAMMYTMKIPIAIFNQKGSNIATNRNSGVEQCRKFKCTHTLMLDSDISFPHTALLRLLGHNKEIVGATYARRTHPHTNLARPLGDVRQDVNQLTEVAAIPTGCMLIRMDVFDKLKRPYFRFPTMEEGGPVPPGYEGMVEDDGKPRVLGEDYSMCWLARGHGVKVWLDVELSFELVHWGEAGFRLTDKEEGYESIELPASSTV